MKVKILFILSLLLTITITAQTTEDNTTSIDTQFKSIYEKSSNYKEHKVILKSSYGKLHKNVLDTLKSVKTEIQDKNIQIDTQKNLISKLEEENTNVKSKLEETKKIKDSTSLFGLQLSKTLYSVIIFTTIIILIIALGLFIYKFKNSNVLTTKAKSDLKDVESEFDIFRKKSLEREQKLRRQLQDEVIKNRNS